ncbi:PLP-dependent aminotransferase family protein [Furfurilactobacillus sp. WILCCON 0119]
MTKTIFSDRVSISNENRLGQLFANDLGQNGVCFSAGNPNPALFPTVTMKQAFTQVIDHHGAHLFEYQAVDGPFHLRELLADRAQQTAIIPATAANVLLTQGGQQAIDLVARLFLNPGDELAVEAPTYVGALASFDQYAPRYHDVPMTRDGMDLDALEATLKQHPNIKLVYTVPDFHNPTGVTMPTENRKRLVALAEHYDVYIVEDTPYRDLRYTGHQLPAIKAFDTHDRVIFISSFSKILMPGLRTGWIIAGTGIIQKLRQLKETSDLESPAIMLQAITNYLDHGLLDEHIATLIPVYQQRRDAMIAALTRFMPETVHYTTPAGGFFIWLTCPDDLDTTALLTEISATAHVSFVPGQVFYAHQNVTNTLRLNFSGVTPAEITSGIKRFGEALTRQLTQSVLDQ